MGDVIVRRSDGHGGYTAVTSSFTEDSDPSQMSSTDTTAAVEAAGRTFNPAPVANTVVPVECDPDSDVEVVTAGGQHVHYSYASFSALSANLGVRLFATARPFHMGTADHMVSYDDELVGGRGNGIPVLSQPTDTWYRRACTARAQQWLDAHHGNLDEAIAALDSSHTEAYAAIPDQQRLTYSLNSTTRAVTIGNIRNGMRAILEARRAAAPPPESSPPITGPVRMRMAATGGHPARTVDFTVTPRPQATLSIGGTSGLYDVYQGTASATGGAPIYFCRPHGQEGPWRASADGQGNWQEVQLATTAPAAPHAPSERARVAVRDPYRL